MNWQLKTFEEFTPHELYQVLKLRSDVFVVEQTCPYSDMDNSDLVPGCLHLIAFSQDLDSAQDRDPLDQSSKAVDPLKGQSIPTVVSYARLLPPGASYPGLSSIGRVVTHPSYRSTGLGHELIQHAIQHTLNAWPDSDIKIGAQAHLEKFYAGHGFKVISDLYIEDGIPHVHMLLSAAECLG